MKPVTPERDSYVRISVTDADDHTTQQINESRKHSLSERVALLLPPPPPL